MAVQPIRTADYEQAIVFFLAGENDPRTQSIDTPKGTVYIWVGDTGGTLWQKQDNGPTNNWTLFQEGTDLGITQLTGDVTAGPGTGSQVATVAFVGGATAANVASATALSLAATSANTASTIVKRDASGNFRASSPLDSADVATKGYVDALSLGITQLTGDVTAGPGSGSQAATVVLVGGATAADVASTVTNAVVGKTNLTTTGSVPYVSASGTLNKDTSFNWDSTTHRLYIGVNASANNVTARGDLYIYQTDAAGGAVIEKAGGAAAYLLRRENGSNTSPTGVLSGETIGGVYGTAWESGGSAFPISPAGMEFWAQENQTTTAHGAGVRFVATKLGSTTRQLVGAFTASSFNSAAYVSVYGVGGANVFSIGGYTGASSISWQVPSAQGGANTLLKNDGSGNLIWITLTSLFDTLFGSSQGSILYRNATVWTTLGPGTANGLLQTGGAGADPQWTAPGGSGSFTTVDAKTVTVVNGIITSIV